MPHHDDFGMLGKSVEYHYRSATGHGTVTGVAHQGTTRDTTEYTIHELDHHPGEPATVRHHGSALHTTTAAANHAAVKREDANKNSSAGKGKK